MISLSVLHDWATGFDFRAILFWGTLALIWLAYSAGMLSCKRSLHASPTRVQFGSGGGCRPSI